MLIDYSRAYHNVYHFTCESILPIIYNMDNIKKGDVLLVPDYAEYPIDFIKRILPRAKIQSVHIPEAKYPELDGVNTYYYNDGQKHIKNECDRLLSYVDKLGLGKSVMINVRLHNRRWKPSSKVQELIDILREHYLVIVVMHPDYEKEPPLKLYDCKVVLNPTWLEQMEIANSVDYAISLGGGAGDIYSLVAQKPSIRLMYAKDCESNTHTFMPNQGKTIVLTDGGEMFKERQELWRVDRNRICGNMYRTVKDFCTWNNDIELVSVNQVIGAFNSLMES